MENHKATAGRPEPGECGAGKATSFLPFAPASSQSPAEKLKKEKGFDSPSLSRYRLQLIIHRTQLI
ncbi:hypothetical protein DJ252_22280 [Salmonella enterica subsp. enterica serovar Uzaramo]|uniref:Uncharacterized protein n=1 Tax=Salmonella enterica TaxID=28901 RepID=A0A760AFP6_SALER|nr:hypothetical protein [Salmonella enterica]EEE9947672.1 hypothetical protein [Salmonella enterica subsp. enterica serovar Uzaramo]EIM5530202.1 hypothetical protein [Salmonella enterica subsp. enterica]EEM9512519.1 hypothetical protein [Salmonella enterica]ELQ0397266.1 hypothetical protein [Salmonella enterica]